jgi:hypothetical protein
MARTNLGLQDELIGEFFRYDIQGERVVPNHPEYWAMNKASQIGLPVS